MKKKSLSYNIFFSNISSQSATEKKGWCHRRRYIDLINKTRGSDQIWESLINTNGTKDLKENKMVTD